MNLKKCMFLENRCYTSKEPIQQFAGIVVHSTGCNNPNICRYVQPSESDPNYNTIIDDIGKNRYSNDWNNPTASKAVHAFIGKNSKGVVETYQTLPFDICAWGVGKGKKGSYNYNPTAHIQFEICEDNLKDEAYFNAIYKEATEFCAYLCKMYGISPDQICSHKEAYTRGYASNHGDPDHWFKIYGKTMNDFRADVQKIITPQVLYKVQIGAFRNIDYAKARLEEAKKAGFTDAYITKVNID